MLNERLMTLIKALLFLCLTILLTSCLEIKQGININKDGSGEARLEVAVQKEWASQLVPKLKGDMSKGWSIVEEKEKEGKHAVIFNRKFKDISELNDNENRYTFSSERKGFLKKSYILEVSQLKSSDMPFPYEITIKVPGSIYETDGIKISSNEVKWNLQGLKRGTKLSVKSSAFALPDFASLKESFNKSFNSVFYHEAIVFLRDGNLWVMDSDGKNQRQLTKEGVGEWSASRDGKIVFDRFAPLYKDGGLTDLNIYHIDSIKVGEIKKLTSDNHSIDPLISPDGTMMVFQKALWDGEPHYGGLRGKGLWMFDLKNNSQEELVGIVPIPDEIKKKRDELYASFGKGEMDDKKWSRDSTPIWSYDSKTLTFARGYDPGGYVSYIIDIERRQPPTPLPEEIVGVADLYDNKVIVSDCILSYTLVLYDTKDNKTDLLAKNVCVTGANFSPDGKRILYYTPPDSTGPEGLWVVGVDGKDKQKVLAGRINNRNIEWISDGKKIMFVPIQAKQPEIWLIDSDGSNRRKLTDNASSPKWTKIPRITFVSASVAKIIILVITALIGISLLFGMVLLTRKAVKAVIPKRRVAPPRGIYCPQCGKENSATASFCTNCGQSLK